MYDFLKIGNKVIVITGISGDIGSAVAINAKKFGVKVLGFDIKEPIKEVLDCLEMFCIGDATSEYDAANFIEQIIGRFDIDAVVCCAGLAGQIVDAEDIDLSHFLTCINSSVLGTAVFVKLFAPIFKKNKAGNFIFLSSVAGVRGTALMPAYTGAKHAINGLMKSFARELGPWGIRVNSILPGLINSKIARSVHHSLDSRLNKKTDSIENYVLPDNLAFGIPLRRLGTANDVSNLVLFLISSASSYIHGSMISVDGGLLVK